MFKHTFIYKAYSTHVLQAKMHKDTCEAVHCSVEGTANWPSWTPFRLLLVGEIGKLKPTRFLDGASSVA